MIPHADFFLHYRDQIIGIDQHFPTPYGEMPLTYMDWTASGRLYRPIERQLTETIGPWVANTHTETTYTGRLMTAAYHEATEYIKSQVGANENDALISGGSGMTGVINKFQRMLGLRLPERFQGRIHLPEKKRPVVLVSHMEHHSNHTSWLETIADVEIIRPDALGILDLNHLEELLTQYAHRKEKYVAVTACSNVTGLRPPYYEVAELAHRHGAWCFVDFACSGPYVDIQMHPPRPEQQLDAIFFSPHKFLGGPGSPGILVFNRELYDLQVPDEPGGGTVTWTDPWGNHVYIGETEVREDGGTPPFLQTLRAAMALSLKAEMGPQRIQEREHAMVQYLLKGMAAIPGMQILAGHICDRLGVVSFNLEPVHYHAVARILNDRFGIQTRGGCACAGTYGHYLLGLSPEESARIRQRIAAGDESARPGWVRASLHPTTTLEEVDALLEALEALARHHTAWLADYRYDPRRNRFTHYKETPDNSHTQVRSWLQPGQWLGAQISQPS